MSQGVQTQLQALLESTLAKIAAAENETQLEEIRLKCLGKKGELTAVLRELGSLSAQERPKIGKEANEVKERIEQVLSERQGELKKKLLGARLGKEWIDFTLPGDPVPHGRLHPLSLVMNEVIDIFRSLGFQEISGPEIETDYYNFEALNIPPDHPARDMWDSLYLDNGSLLRTHTSPVQIRVMEKLKPPLRVISAGKCYRRDAVDATHCFQFHQVEGFMVDENVSFANLKGVLSTFARLIFGTERKVQFIPSYFPFTEPSVEVLIDCFNCTGDSQEKCRVCGGERWLEILGAGMIHPFVLRVVNTPSNFTGFAFGLGIERIAMLKYGIDDIRFFYENEERFLRQF